MRGLSLAAAHCAQLAEDNNDPELQYLTLIQVCDSLYTIHKLLIGLATDAGCKALVADAPWAKPVSPPLSTQSESMGVKVHRIHGQRC